MEKSVPWFRVKGLIAAPVTPLTKDGEIDVSKIDGYVDKLCNDGVKNVYVNGTTGEGFSLSVEERKILGEKWLSAGKNKLDSIILQIGTGNLKTTQELARHAEKIGVPAIAAIPTVPLKPKCVDDIVVYLKQIAEVAPNTALFYYHFDKLTGVSFAMETLLDAVKDQVPTFHGMKFTSEDLYDLSRCLQHSGGKYQTFSSRDELLLPSLCLGGQAFVGSTHNFLGRFNNRIYEAFHRGDIDTARQLQYQQHKFIHILRKYGADPSVHKHIMALSGFDCGPARYPFADLSEEQIQNLKKDLEEIKYFEMIK
ncbi:N-acetylneuraminate lyase-like [Ptychodera flava]|uniref:N-acetylneuraminate lyase-like n=1 Tax=Ptychodera flava TaxID=63121 RepID=UPI00396A3AA3